MKRFECDVVVVGSGPGGCVVARDLAQNGRQVVLLEKGGDGRAMFGTPLGIALRLEKRWSGQIRRTVEGDTLVLASTLGGGTVIYAGSAFLPDLPYWQRYGIELDPELVSAARKECWVNHAPDEFVGPGTRRIQEAADALGIPFEPLYRHVDFDRCLPGCEKCTFGCPRDAKWTGRVYVQDAVRNGAVLLTRTKVREILVDQGRAVGVRAVGPGGRLIEVRAQVVVCAAGGVHTAELLQGVGLSEAGRRFTGDPTVFSFGFVSGGPSNVGEHNMPLGHHDEEHGVVYCGMASPGLAWHVQLWQDKGLGALWQIHRRRRVLSVFAKISDEGQGEVLPDGQVHKTFTQRDRERFAHSREVSTRILERAGCPPDTIHHTGLTLGHPSGTAGVGRLLDVSLETPIQRLYCCDTSVFPEAPGRPPTLTMVVLGKRLARHLHDTL